MEYSLGFGKNSVNISLDEKYVLGVLKPQMIERKKETHKLINDALDNPIGSNKIEEIVKPGEKIVIITSDITRPMPSYEVLPIIIERLIKKGIKTDDIKVIFALGSHRKHTRDEMIKLVGLDVFSKVECMDADGSRCIHMGVTSYGTPVDIFEEVATADRRICLGNIEYHYFAGYSGGAKAIMPGVSNRKAIQANHSKMTHSCAKTGELKKNPVRLDIEEAISFIPIDFILNVILNDKKQIIHSVAGHHIKAHRAGCKFLDSIYQCRLDELGDIVIVSPGGYPKDINMYQAQKALDNAKHAVKNGGVIIWIASCAEGFGEKVFERWIEEATSPESMVKRIEKHFELGGHKAAAISMILEKCEVFMVTDLSDDTVKKAFIRPFDNINKALEAAREKMGSKAKIVLMPFGGSTLPIHTKLKCK
ncbi:nickel-dependent lactate racemase family protein [Alkalibacter mobilis]|uniref:nickel-dependent lactate racemase n=1 Tax=Alkalibacter mobilis TaxID=2787712 RepID=UPI00189FED23|nr:nickel-dependent lactate racemase [Alkalibacter mobilis]MBF7097297.1 nickel-dependent lactate racemase [Alkalibacter mobilis]